MPSLVRSAGHELAGRNDVASGRASFMHQGRGNWAAAPSGHQCFSYLTVDGLLEDLFLKNNVSDSVGVGCSQRLCISDNILSNDDTGARQTTFRAAESKLAKVTEAVRSRAGICSVSLAPELIATTLSICGTDMSHAGAGHALGPEQTPVTSFYSTLQQALANIY